MSRIGKREATRLALEYAAAIMLRDDFGQIYGDDIAGEAWNNKRLAEALQYGQTTAAHAIERLLKRRSPTSARKQWR